MASLSRRDVLSLAATGRNDESGVGAKGFQEFTRRSTFGATKTEFQRGAQASLGGWNSSREFRTQDYLFFFFFFFVSALTALFMWSGRRIIRPVFSPEGVAK